LKTLQLRGAIALPGACEGNFSAIAFDGRFFYLANPKESRIYKYGLDFTLAGRCACDKNYAGICFDPTEQCFWAFERERCSLIYKLDRDFRDTGHIKLKHDAAIRGISCGCGKNTLLAAYDSQIREIPKTGCCACVTEQATGYYDSVLSVPPFFAVLWQDKSKHEIRLYNAHGDMAEQYRVPMDYCPKDLVFYPGEGHGASEILILAVDCHCAPVILRCHTQDFDMAPCDARRSACEKIERKKTPCEKQCLAELISSIALVETALSHILNAEGEKLQKAIEISGSLDDLLAANRSVNNTLHNAVFLENALCTKMGALIDLCSKLELCL